MAIYLSVAIRYDPVGSQRHKMDISAADGECAAIVHIRHEIVYNTGP